jgi:hypothetical protein
MNLIALLLLTLVSGNDYDWHCSALTTCPDDNDVGFCWMNQGPGTPGTWSMLEWQIDDCRYATLYKDEKACKKAAANVSSAGKLNRATCIQVFNK